MLAVSVHMSGAAPTKAKQGDNRSVSSKKQQGTAQKSKGTHTLRGKNGKPAQKADKDRKGNSRRTAKARGTHGTPAPAVVEEVSDDGEFMEYKVRKGDTLENLALRFGLERDDIVQSNNNLGKKLAPGRTLLIPRVGESDNDKEEEYVELSSKPLKLWKSQEEKYMLVKVAKSFMGAPYRYGGDSVRGLDCSAYVKKIYDIFDVQLPRSARDQFRAGSKVPRDDLAVGDLVFFRTKRYVKYATHVGIYIGDGNFIHSSSAHCKIGVRIDSLKSDFYTKTFLGATRVKKAPDDNTDTTKYPDIPFTYNNQNS